MSETLITGLQVGGAVGALMGFILGKAQSLNHKKKINQVSAGRVCWKDLKDLNAGGGGE